MHFLLYVCLPTDEADSSLQARKSVCEYLNKERFVRDARFSGYCDYFSVGGRYSGVLNLLRLKRTDRKVFSGFLAEYKKVSGEKEAHELFRHSFPKYKKKIPLLRTKVPCYGYSDDAQIIDDVLYSELKSGFSEYVSCAVGLDDPNVIFTDLDEDEWPATASEAIGRHWVVVIDYHD